MGIQYFYHIIISDLDNVDLESDILSAVRRSYFASFDKIRDKITYDSEGKPMLYDYCIEKNKPLRWTVKSADGTLIQDTVSAGDDRYYLCTYRDEKVFKRLLFSKFHTLLKAEYLDENGTVICSVEPRKGPNGLCLLYKNISLDEPIVLSAMPDVADDRVAARVRAEFTDFTASASTDEGVVWFMSDEQILHLREAVEQIGAELDAEDNLSFIGDDAPLFDKINAKDFNIRRNLSASLDISQAKDFGNLQDEEKPIVEIEENLEATEESVLSEETDIIVSEADAVDSDVQEDLSYEETIQEETSQEESVQDNPGIKPDKLIMADGAVYSYFGDLDANENRSGYGRTLTDIGRIAYEGMYYNDKRSGKGAYFYKDGTLCYSGDWSENVRHGTGVGISAKDGSMHIGKWVNNKPEGNGVRVSAEGEVIFVCKELSDGGTILMQYPDDETVIISRYDKNGAKTSEKKVSLTDF